MHVYIHGVDCEDPPTVGCDCLRQVRLTAAARTDISCPMLARSGTQPTHASNQPWAPLRVPVHIPLTIDCNCVGVRILSRAIYILMAHVVMAYIVMAYIVMAYIVMAHIAMAYIM